VIKSFKCRETERIWNQQISRKFPPGIQKVTLRKLLMIYGAEEIRDLTIPPAKRLEKLKGNRQGQYSIRINDQFRICFVWKDSDAFDVEMVDYHS
jgi:proteic killer suppression protein